jgi:hypothetical protein
MTSGPTRQTRLHRIERERQTRLHRIERERQTRLHRIERERQTRLHRIPATARPTDAVDNRIRCAKHHSA